MCLVTELVVSKIITITIVAAMDLRILEMEVLMEVETWVTMEVMSF